MKLLKSLLSGIEVVSCRGNLNQKVSGIQYDSRKVQPGDVFVAIRGFRDDGNKHAAAAAAAGAVAVFSSAPPDPGLPVAWIQILSERRVLNQLAACFFDYPGRQLEVVGVTGTNGKTTTVALIHHLLSEVEATARIGTLGGFFAGELKKNSLTTPEAPDLFSFMNQVRLAGGKNVIMEVSSAALDLHRVDNIEFRQAVFTSFSGDHLDFHQSMERYLEAKFSLFRKLGPGSWALINVDDPSCRRVIAELNCPYVTFGFSENADIRPLRYQADIRGLNGMLATPQGQLNFSCPLLGRVNLFNVMAAVGSALIKGLSRDTIMERLQSVQPLPGRLQSVPAGSAGVIVDYAHTDGALQQLLTSLRELIKGKIYLVFGAGGGRDKSKRRRMGRVAAELADFLLVSSDNPRLEDPLAIIADICEGFPASFDKYLVEPDRRRAIFAALERAERDDLVVIAGKGHEDYQIFADRTIPFSDAGVVSDWLAEKENG